MPASSSAELQALGHSFAEAALAQSGLPSGNVLALVVLLGVVILLGVAAVVFARKFSSQFSDDYKGSIFTLQELREMHRAGKLTDHEFEKAKALVVKAELKANEIVNIRSEASDETGEIKFDDSDFEVEDNQLKADPAHRIVKANPGPRRKDDSEKAPPADGDEAGTVDQLPDADDDTPPSSDNSERTTDMPPKQ